MRPAERVAAQSRGADGAAWAVALFRRSIQKQEKFRSIAALLGDPRGKTCLDIGADNGVISWLLRQEGGTWHSADLDPAAVEAIRALVGEPVTQIEGGRTPFPDRAFDVVVIVDFLEHIHEDRAFARDLARILRPGGRLIVNVPHLKRRSLLNRLRPWVGLSDARHGHVRPGYDLAGLREVLGERFRIEATATYSRSISEGLDVLLNALYGLRGRGGEPSRKGTIVTSGDMKARRGEFLLLSALYPALWAVTRLDRLLFLQDGYKLIVRAALRDRAAEAAS